MKHKLRRSCLMLALAMLCTLLYAGSAYADNPQLNVTVDGVAATKATTEYSGKYYYMVSVEKPAGASTFQTGWNSDIDAALPEQWDAETENLSFPVIGGEEEEITEDAFYVRLNENAPVQKFVFHYDLTANYQGTFAIEEGNPILMEDFTLRWTQKNDADWGWVIWTMPNGDERFCGLGDDARNVNSLNLTDFWEGCDPEDMIAQPGTYTATVRMLVDGKLAVATRDFTVSMPTSATEKPVLESSVNDVTVGEYSTEEKTMDMYANVGFRVSLPEDVNAEDADVEVFNGRGWNGTWYDDDDDEDDENGYWYSDWNPDYAENTTVQAYARYSTDKGITWTYSDPVRINAQIDDEINREFQARELQATAATTVARDQLLEVTITKIPGVDRYGAFLQTEDGDWIADSRWEWVDPETEGTTVVSIPVANCEVGKTYDVYAYAIMNGAAQKEAKVGRVRVTENTGDNSNGLLIVTKDSFNVNERADFSVFFTKADEFKDKQLRTEVSIVRLSDNEEVDYWDERGYDFRDERRFDQRGTYRLTATLFCSEEGKESEEYDLATSTRDFEVVGPGELNLGGYKLFGGESIPEQEDYPVAISELTSGALQKLNTTNGVSDLEVDAEVWVHCKDQEEEEEYKEHVTWNRSWPGFEPIDTTDAEWVEMKLWIRAWDENGRSYDEQYLEELIPVIGSDLADAEHPITLTVKPAEGESIHLVNQKMNIEVTAPGAKEIRLADTEDSEIDSWDELEDDEESVSCDWHRTSGRSGPYRIWAVATYDGGAEFRSEIQTFTLEQPTETLNPFTISTTPAVVERGQDVTVYFKGADVEGAEYDLDLWSVYDDDFDFDRSCRDWTEENSIAVIHTIGLPAGEYGIRGWGDKEGWNGYSTDDDDREAEKLTVVEPDLNNGEIMLQVDKKNPAVKEDISVSAYAPGADYIELVPDYGNKPDETMSNEGYDDSNESIQKRWSYDRPGTYQILARAYYPVTIGCAETNPKVVDSDPFTVTVTSNGTLAFNPAPTATLTDNRELTINATLPQNADEMSVDVDVTHNGSQSSTCAKKVTKDKLPSGELSWTISADDLGVEDGDLVTVYFNAWGTGYERGEYEVTVPVLGESSEEVSLVFTGEYAGKDSITVPINKRVTVQATFTDLSEIQGFQMVGAENEDYEDLSCEFSFDTPGQYTVFAEVTFDNEKWVPTNGLTVTATSKGSVDAFRFTSGDVTVQQGKPAQFVFTKSTDGADYRVDLNPDSDEYNQKFNVDADSVTVTVDTAELEVGTYRVRGKAGATDYEARESDGTVLLTVVDPGETVYEFTWPETYDGENDPQVTVTEDSSPVDVSRITVSLENKTDATCYKAGEVKFKATVDNVATHTDIKSYTISKTNHKFDDEWTVAWNQDYSDFTATRSCTEDGCTRTVTYTGEKQVVATYTDLICEKAGQTAYTALIEGETQIGQEVVPTEALGHDWNDWTITPATCTSAGEKTRTCKREGCPYHTTPQKVDIPKLDHKWEQNVTASSAATCTEDGADVYKCVNGGCTETKTVTIPATGHRWSSATEESYSWEPSGDNDYKCTAVHTCLNTNCPLQNKTETVTVTAAKKQGANACETIYTAAFGTDGFTTQKKTITKHINPLEHHDAVAAQIGVAGNVEYWQCTRCNKSFSDEQGTQELTNVVIPALQPSGGGDTPTPTTDTITIPVSGEGKDAKTAAVTVEVEGSTATITSADIDSVLEAEDVGTVIVNVSSLDEKVDEVVLPAELVNKVAKAVADKENDASGLEIKLPTGSVTFDAKTVAAIAKQAEGKDVKLHLDTVTESSLNSSQQSTVKELNALVVLDAYVTADGKRISDFNGGKATFSVPVKLADGQTAAGVVAYYVAENGDKTEIPCTYDGENATGTVKHFSNYVVVYDTEKAQKAAEDAKAIEDVVKVLEALPAASDVKLEDKEAIEKARAAYDALTDEQKAKVDPAALKKLTDAEAALKAKESGEPTPEPGKVSYDDLSDKEKKQADDLVDALGVDKDTAAAMVKLAEELGVSMDTVKLSGDALAKMDVDSSDPAGADFGQLTARVTKRANKTLTLKWTKQKNADGYLIYGNKCGKGNKMKLVKTIQKNGTVSFTQKKLKKGTYYKYMVVAYKNVNGQKMPIAASVVLHAPTKGGKTTVAKSVKVNKTKVSVKKGKSVTIKATEVKDEKKLKMKTHRAVKFESSNKKIATVNAKGKITGKKKGKCTIWAYAQNGIFKAIKVTVK